MVHDPWDHSGGADRWRAALGMTLVTT
jgi:hypothetical protein